MKNRNWVFWFIGIGSLIFMGVVLYENYTYATALDKDHQGLFGDMFGASNALFTGLSFTGVIIAILLPRQELKLQRNELELTREEMKLTRNEFETQNETLTKQQFENTFFQMISMYRDNTEKVSGTIDGKATEGKDLFYKFHKHLIIRFQTFMKDRFNSIEENKLLEGDFYTNIKKENTKFTIAELTKIYYLRSKVVEDELIKYFSTITIILKLVDDSNIKDKFFYISILKSHFTKYETAIIFYQTLSQDPYSTFRKLIDKYRIVDDLDVKLIINTNHFVNYKQKQFMNDFNRQSDQFLSASNS